MSSEIALRPSYWASVSGGKDSLYMLNYILHNLDRYPLDGVAHFELEIDYPFIHDVIDYMESECKRFGIRYCLSANGDDKETDRMNVLYIVSAFFDGISVGSVIALIIYNRER